MKKRLWFFVISLAAMMLISGSAFAAGETLPDESIRTYATDFNINPDAVDGTRVTVKNGIYAIMVDTKQAIFVSPAKKNLKTLVIQDTVKANGKTYKVTGISADACLEMGRLTKVTIGKNVKWIGHCAFANCEKLTTVLGGEAVETIYNEAFFGCISLKAITLHSKVKNIGLYAFMFCEKLKTITILTKKLTTSKVGSGAFSELPAKVTVKCPASKLKTYKIILVKKGDLPSTAIFK